MTEWRTQCVDGHEHLLVNLRREGAPTQLESCFCGAPVEQEWEIVEPRVHHAPERVYLEDRIDEAEDRLQELESRYLEMEERINALERNQNRDSARPAAGNTGHS